MTTGDWMDLTVMERKKYNYLCEVMDLSQQIGATLDRNDVVSLKMLVAMRNDPILALQELEHSMKERRKVLTQPEQERVTALLSGKAQPKDNTEQTFCKQAGLAHRELQRVLELDRRINLRMAGDSSFYKQ